MVDLVTIKESLLELKNSNLFSDKINQLFDTIVLKLTDLWNNKVSLEMTLDKHNYILCESLKELIGRPIYWATFSWKHEKHIISGIRYDIVNTDFFDTKDKKYKGKKCVLIYVDNNDGYYLADDIGRTLFFDENEAINHSKYCSKTDD